jgi:serine protease Do
LRGVVTNEMLDVCFAYFPVAPLDAPPMTEAQMTDLIKGDLSLTINWQLFSRIQNKVVFEKTIDSKFSQKKTIRGGPGELAELAFEDNMKLLAADPGLRAELAGAALARGKPLEPEPLGAPIAFDGHDIQPRPLAEAAGSVVVIYAGDALGSGVLVSRDGYILTDAHVVGASSTVRLRWSDGKETHAEVVRVSKARDVALLKTDADGRVPLPMQTTPPPVGSTVYAIGSPDGQQFAGTLTRGVVSAMRTMEGLNYIQSDVTTGHGGSGGPLLDEKGEIVGLTDLAFGHDATSSGLNFFTPIKDAIAFLALDVH